MQKLLLNISLLLLLLLGAALPRAAEAQVSMREYSFRLNAIQGATAGEIILATADPDTARVDSMILYIKGEDAFQWSRLGTWPTTARQISIPLLSITGLNYTLGTPVEFCVKKYFTNSANQPNQEAFGYVLTGYDVGVPSTWGTMHLVIDTTATGNLAAELNQLEEDLIGEGWCVNRILVDPSDTPPQVKSRIRNDWLASGGNAETQAVYLIGHVPVPYSGSYDTTAAALGPPDGHNDHTGAWPADVYYGEMDSTWTDNGTVANTSRPVNANAPGDGKFDQNNIWGVVNLSNNQFNASELWVGRVDFDNMPEFGKTHEELLRQYLNRTHDYKFKVINPLNLALLDDNFAFLGAERTSESALRTALGLFGGNVFYNTDDYFDAISNNQLSIKWAYGAGGGNNTSAGGLNDSTAGANGRLRTQDYANDSTFAAFQYLFGSYFGDWNTQNNLLRATLAGEGFGVATFWGARPQHNHHMMGLGRPVGKAGWWTQNSGVLGFNPGTLGPNDNFFTQGNEFMLLPYKISLVQYNRAIHSGLMGDPSLRLHTVFPPSGLTAQGVSNNTQVQLDWNASPDTDIMSYWVYRIDNGCPIVIDTVTAPTLTYTDTNPLNPGGNNRYMVRAVKADTALSGGYQNPSQGIFVDIALTQNANGTIAVVGNSTVCAGDNSTTLDLTGHTGTVLNWISSTDNWVSSTNVPNSSSTVYTPPQTLSQTTCYTVAIDNGGTTEYSDTVCITVDPCNGPGNGTLGPDQTGCLGNNSGTIPLTGNTGTIVRWHSSTDNFATFSSINFTGATYNYSNLLQRTCFRAKLDIAGSAPQYSDTMCVDIQSCTPLNGTLSTASDSLCMDAAPLTPLINLTGHTGTVLRWESSNTGWLNKSTIANTSASYTPATPITQTTCYRAVIDDGGTETTSDTLCVVVSASSSGGQMAAGGVTTVCSGGATPTINLTGVVGTILRWEKDDAANNFNNPTTIPGSAGQQSLTDQGITVNTCYRAVVKSGSCPVATTVNPYCINISGPSPGTLASSQTICPGDSPNALNINAAAGPVLGWESSTDGFVTTTPIANTTTTLTPQQPTQTICYRAEIDEPTCGAVFTNSVCLTVQSNCSGTLSAGQDSACATGFLGTQITLSGHQGTVKRWESSTDNFNTVSTISNTTTTVGTGGLTQTTCYRAVTEVVPGGQEFFSDTACVYVAQPSSTGAISNTGQATVCAGQPGGPITLTGAVGNVIEWQTSIDAVTWNTEQTGPSTSFTIPSVTQDLFVQAIVTNAPCASVTSNLEVIQVTAGAAPGTLTADQTICSGGAPAQLDLTGAANPAVRWESSTDGGTSWTTIANTNDFYTPPALTQRTCYRAVTNDATCGDINSNQVCIDINAGCTGGTADALQPTVCSGDDATFTLSGASGNVVRWEFSDDNFVTVNTVGNTTTTFTRTNVTQDFCARAVTDNGGTELTSTEACVTVAQPPVAGTVTNIGPASICAGSNAGPFNLAGHTGNVDNWEISTDGGASWNPAGNAGQTSISPAVNADVCYRAVVSNAACGTPVTTNQVCVDAEQPSAAGTLSADQTICAGDPASALNYSIVGQTGNIVRWESSTDNFNTVTPIANTTQTLNPGAINQTTQYRVVVQNPPCAEVTSNVVQIQIGTANGGTLTSDQTFCNAPASHTMNLSGQTGNIVRWESSVDGGANWNPIANTSTSFNATNITQTTQYRAVVASGNCESFSNVVTVSIGGATAGTLSSGTQHCSTTNNGTLVLNGTIGNVVNWESSTDQATWTPIANTSQTLNYNNLTQTTFYRVNVENNGCPDVSNVVSVEVTNLTNGTISGPATHCQGANSGTITLTGANGNVIRWETSTNGGVSWSTAPGTGTSISYNNLTQTTGYRVVYGLGACQNTSNVVTITVLPDPATVGGTTSGGTSVCTNTPNESGTITLSGETGNVIRWERSTDGGATWVPTPVTTTTFDYVGLTQTTQFRAVVQSAACPPENSSASTVTINALSAGGTAGPSVSVCSGNNSGSVALSGQTGTPVQWESSTDGGSSWSVIANTSPVQTYSNLTQETLYRALVSNNGCAPDYSAPAQISITGAGDGGVLGPAATVCNTTGNGTLTLTGYNGTILWWEASTDNFATSVQAPIQTPSYQYFNINITVSFRVAVRSGGCTVYSTPVTIVSAGAAPVGGSITGPATTCISSTTDAYVLNGFSGGTVARWELSTDGFATISNTYSTTSPVLSGTNLPSAGSYQLRAVVTNGACESYSDVFQLSAIDCCPAPTSASVGNITATTAEVTWTDAPGATPNFWEVSYRPVGSPTWIPAITFTQPYPLTGLSPDTDYEVRVRAVCSNGNSGYANTTFSTPFECATPNLALLVAGSSQIDALWSPVPGAIRYVLRYRIAGSGAAWTREVINSGTSFSITGLNPATPYQVQVRTICGGPNSPYNTQVATTLGVPVLCQEPTGVAVSSVTNASATVSWNSVVGAISYRVRYRVRNSGASWTSELVTGATMLALNNLNNETEYEVQVRAQCGSSNSAYTTPRTYFTTLGDGCYPPTFTVYWDANAGQVRVEWPLLSNAMFYDVFYRPAGTSVWQKRISAANYVFLPGLVPGVQYEVRVRAFCTNGLFSDLSEVQIYDFSDTRLGVQSNASAAKLNVYPNPNRGEFNISIETPAEETVRFKMLDVTGRAVYEVEETLGSGSHTIPVSAARLSAGVYLLRVEGDSFNETVKVVIE